MPLAVLALLVQGAQPGPGLDHTAQLSQLAQAQLNEQLLHLIGARSLKVETRVHPRQPVEHKRTLLSGKARSAGDGTRSASRPPLIIVPGMFSSAITSTLDPLRFKGSVRCAALFAAHGGHYQSWLSVSELLAGLSSCFTDSLSLEWDGQTGDATDPPGITTSVTNLSDHAAARHAIDCAVYNDANLITGGVTCVELYGALFTFLRGLGYVDNVVRRGWRSNRRPRQRKPTLLLRPGRLAPVSHQDLFYVPYDWRRGLKYWMKERLLLPLPRRPPPS